MEKHKYKLNKKIKEVSTTGGSATFTPGTGGQYATPFAFNKDKNAKGTARNYYYKLGFKPVPDKIKGSGLEVKKLYEQEPTDAQKFQQTRIEAFDSIEERINALLPILSNAKNQTIEYYNDNPTSFDIIFPTDLVQTLITEIEKIIKGKE
jgi:hypothetical protein